MSKRIIVDISKEEFCEKTRTTKDCWIWRTFNEKYAKFWEDREPGREDWYYLDTGTDRIYRFKDMPQYGEIWMSMTPRNVKKAQWDMWNTWTQY